MLRTPHMTKRAFLGGATALASVGYLPAQARDVAQAFGVSPAAIADLQAMSGPVIYLPGDPGFGHKAHVNNLRYMGDLPAAVIVCPTADTAVQAIQWLNGNDIPFQIKGGGHSYAGYSAGPNVVVYTEGMDSIQVIPHPAEPSKALVKVGAGAINYLLYDRLEEHGLTITHGRCPTVGVAGFVLGGGIGFDMRHLGVASDLLIETEIALADGRIVTASQSENPDLFWALRGGAGGSFGISTSFTFEAIDVTQLNISVFDRTWRSTDQALMARFTHKLMQMFEADETRQLGSRMSLTYGKPAGNPTAPSGFALNLVGQWTGNAQDLTNMFDELDGILPPAAVRVAFHGPYWPAQHLLEEPEEIMFYQERSTYIPTAPGEDALYAALTTLSERPEVHGTCDLRFFQTGGAINDKPSDYSAYVHRDSQWLPLIGFYWTGQDQTDPALINAGHAWQDRFYEQIRTDFAGQGAYQNFPDPSLGDFAQAYFGSNLPRLSAVKSKYDPLNLFNFAQSVPLA